VSDKEAYDGLSPSGAVQENIISKTASKIKFLTLPNENILLPGFIF
jgi:hypothetical protein